MQDLVDRIYEAAAVPDRWPQVLSDLSRTVGTRGGVLFAINQDGVKWMGSGDAIKLSEAFIATGWMARNNRPQMAVELNRSGFVTDLDFFTDDETHTLPLYAEFLRPRGFFAFAGTYVKGIREDQIFVSMEGFESHAAAAAAIPVLDSLRPHLARAVSLSGQLRLERLKGHVEALAAVGAAAAIVSFRGALQAANSLFSDILGSQVSDFRDRIRLSHPQADRQFTDALADIRAENAGGRSIAIPGGESGAARVLHVLPVRGEARDLFLQSSAILILTQARASNGVGSTLLQSLSISRRPKPNLLQTSRTETPSAKRRGAKACQISP